jgi:hypothetical protein
VAIIQGDQGRYVYSVPQLLALGYVAGWRGNSLIVAVSVCLAESGGNAKAQGYNRDAKGNVTSIDRGLWQINSYWHREVSDACAYDPICNAKAAYTISSGGRSWSPWATYNSGAYRAHIATVTAAYNAGDWQRLVAAWTGGNAELTRMTPSPQGAEPWDWHALVSQAGQRLASPHTRVSQSLRALQGLYT